MRRGTSRPFAALALVLVAAFLASCDGLRLDLFSYNDSSQMPSLMFSPAPSATVYTATQHINIGLPARFSAWSIRYTTDPSLSTADADRWTAYDPDRGLYLASTSDLRAIAYLPNTSQLSAVANGHYDFNIPNVLVYVDPTGSDAASGTLPTAPLKTIQAGIDLAASLYTAGGTMVVVCARAGTYNESPRMKPGVLLRGSYDWSWTPPADVSDPAGLSPTSVINGTATAEAGSGYGDWTPQYALLFPSGMSFPSEVQHFAINSADGGNRSAAVLVRSAQTRLYDCAISGGNASGTATGIWNRGGNLSLESCTVLGRSIGNPLIGNSIGIVNIGATITVRRTNVSSGAAAYGSPPQECAGVYSMDAAASSSLTIEDSSSIIANFGYDSNDSFGVRVSGGSTIIRGGSTIQAGMTQALHDSRSIGLFLDGVLQADVQGCTISGGSASTNDDMTYDGRSYGIMVNNATAGSAVSIQGNRLRGGQAANISAGLRLDGSLGSVVVSGNSVAGDSTQNYGGEFGFAAGIIVGAGVSNDSPIIIERNRIFGGTMPFNDGYVFGLYVLSNDFANPCVVRNNIIHGGGAGPHVLASYGAFVGGSSSSSSEHVYFLGDTIFSGGNPAGTMEEYGIYLDSTSIVNVDIFGCIIDSNELAIASTVPTARPSKFYNNCLRSSQYIISLNPVCMLGGTAYYYSAIDSVGTTGSGNLLLDSLPSWTAQNPIPYLGGANPGTEATFMAFDYGIDATPTLGNALANNGPTIAISATIDDGLDFNGNARHTATPRTIGAIEHF